MLARDRTTLGRTLPRTRRIAAHIKRFGGREESDGERKRMVQAPRVCNRRIETARCGRSTPGQRVCPRHKASSTRGGVVISVRHRESGISFRLVQFHSRPRMSVHHAQITGRPRGRPQGVVRLEDERRIT